MAYIDPEDLFFDHRVHGMTFDERAGLALVITAAWENGHFYGDPSEFAHEMRTHDVAAVEATLVMLASRRIIRVFASSEGKILGQILGFRLQASGHAERGGSSVADLRRAFPNAEEDVLSVLFGSTEGAH